MKRDLSDPASVDLTRLQEKHLHWAKRMLREAIKTACDDAGIEPKQISHASIVSSSGYLLPGLTAYIVQDPTLGIPQNISRQDIVGMGCHAGLNSYKSAAMYAVAHPGQYALCCGVEVLSAQYIWGAESKQKLGTTVVNSLFADGCFAGILRSTPTEPPNNSYFDAPPTWWEQCCDTVALPDMIYRVERGEEKYRFDLSELAPYHVGQGLRVMMHDAMWGGIPVHYAEHVITHTGGKTVLDCTSSALGLEGGPKESLQPTCKALREYGNQSSCSFFFAFDNLVKGGTVCAGDLGIFVTMGPGAGLEMALFTAGKRFTESATRVQVAPPPRVRKPQMGRRWRDEPSTKPTEQPESGKVPAMDSYLVGEDFQEDFDGDEAFMQEAAAGQHLESEGWFSFKVQRSRSSGWLTDYKVEDAATTKPPENTKVEDEKVNKQDADDFDDFGEEEEDEMPVFAFNVPRSRSSGWTEDFKAKEPQTGNWAT